jgi:cyanophycin synthetase
VLPQKKQKIVLEKLHTNQRLLVTELFKMGLAIEMVDEDIELLKVISDDEQFFLLDRFTTVPNYISVTMTADKYLTKEILAKNGIAVPVGNFYCGEEKPRALAYASKLGFPIVFKPNHGSHGDFVCPCLNDKKELRLAIDHFVKHHNNKTAFIIEKYFIGREHRIFMTARNEFAVLERDPAHVFGDGKSTLKQLITYENIRRQKKSRRYLCPISVDAEMKRYLKQHSLTCHYIPKKGEKVYLRWTSNLAKGGVSIDHTNQVHPSVISIAKKVLKIFDLPVVGIDYITGDISQKASFDNYRIIEVNSNPGVAMHHYPAKGKSVNVARMLSRVMFPKVYE